MASRPYTSYNPRYTVTYNNPDKIAPPEAVNSIFLNAGTGKYFDIKRMIMEKRATLNLTNDTGKTIIHYVLENDKLTKHEKHDLVKELIDIGAPVDLADFNGVRPLHMAASQQNRALIRLLISKGAEINSTDNNYMTPMHYSVIPEKQICEKRQLKTLIPEEVRKNKAGTEALFDVIYNNIKNNATIRMYVQHLAVLFNDALFVENEKQREEDLADLKKLAEKSLKLDETAGRQEFEKELAEIRKKIHGRVTSNLNQALSSADISENTTNGWGPSIGGTRDPKHAVLPFSKIRSKFEILLQDAQKERSSARMNLETKYSELRNSYESLSSKFNNLRNMFYFLEASRDYIDATTEPLFHISSPVFNRFATSTTYAQNRLNVIYELQNTYNILGRISGYTIPLDSFDTDNLANASIQPSTRHEPPIGGLINNHTLFITNRSPIGTVGNALSQYLDAFSNLFKNIQRDVISIADFKPDNLDNIANLQLRIVNAMYILSLVRRNNDLVNEGITMFAENIADSQPDAITENLRRLAAYADNYIVTYNGRTFDRICGVSKIRDARGIIRRHAIMSSNNKAMILNVDFRQPVVHSDIKKNEQYYHVHTNAVPAAHGHPGIAARDDYYKFMAYHVDVRDYANEFRVVYDNYEDSIGKTYEALLKLQKSINKMIDIYNRRHGLLAMDFFNNQFIEQSYNQINTHSFNGIMITHINYLKKLPEKFSDFEKKINETLGFDIAVTTPQENVQSTIENLVNTYGYIIEAAKPPILLHTSASASSVAASGIYAEFIRDHALDNTAGRGGNIQLGNIYLARTGDAVNGIVMTGAGLIIPKTQTRLDVFRSILVNHLEFIKYVLIMYQLNESGKSINAETGNYYDMLNNTETRLGSLVNDNPRGVLFAVIAKMVDDIVIGTYENIIDVGVSNYVKSLVAGIGYAPAPAPAPGENALNEAQKLIVVPKDKLEIYKDDSVVIRVTQRSLSGFILNNSRKTDTLQFLAEPFEKLGNTQHRLINFDSIDADEDICYDIDEDVIAELIKGNGEMSGDVNAAERSGETPLSLAVYIQNESIIQTLVQSGGKVIYNSNGNQKNIYEFAFNQLLNIIDSSPAMNIEKHDGRATEYLLRQTNMGKTFKNSKIVLKMAMYLLNHQMAMNASTYPNMWTHTEHNLILQMLNLRDVNKDLIPLARIDNEKIEKEIYGMHTINETIDQIRVKLINERDILIRLDNSINNLRTEQAELNLDAASNAYRLSEIQQLLKELNTERAAAQTRERQYTGQISKFTLSRGTLAANLSGDIADVTTRTKNPGFIQAMIRAGNSGKIRDVCVIYNMFFEYINRVDIIGTDEAKDETNSEYIAYLEAWKVLLARPERDVTQDQTQMVNNLQAYISDKGIIDHNIFIDGYRSIVNLYDKVLNKYGRDYFELSTYLGTDMNNYFYNYALNQLYCIMEHVVKHTMALDYVNTIAHILISTTEKSQDDAQVIDMVNNQLKTSGFFEYCFNTLPKQVVKVVCKMSTGEKDPDVKLSTKDILNISLDKLTTGTVESINKQSLDRIKDSIVPYFVDYLETYIAEMHRCLIKQIKSLMVQARWLKICQILAEKASIEK